MKFRQKGQEKKETKTFTTEGTEIYESGKIPSPKIGRGIERVGAINAYSHWLSAIR